MMNKRGVFFPLYLVVLTLVMCSLVVTIYYVQNQILPNSLTSPVKIMQIEDKQVLFEAWENYSISSFILASDKSSDLFVGEVKDSFCKSFASEENRPVVNFLFSDLFYKDRKWGSAFESIDSRLGFCNDIYTFEKVGDTLVVSRVELGKKFRISGDDKTKTNFAVDVNYKYSKNLVFSVGK